MAVRPWWDSLLGRIRSQGASLPLSGALDFLSPLRATFNPATTSVEVRIDPSLLTGEIEIDDSDFEVIDGDNPQTAFASADAALGAMAVNVKRFGAVGDGVTDDTAAVLAWLAYLEESGRVGYLSRGVYRIHNTSIDLPEGVKIFGDGAAHIGCFPQTGGDKSFLRPGFKHLISGSALLFTGTASSTLETIREDRFAEASYCLKYGHVAPFELRQLAIIQDMDVLDADGDLTDAASDNRADYEAGLVSLAKVELESVTIFGYFQAAGLWLHSEDALNINCDYSSGINCRITALAITGHDSTAATAASLTGFRAVGGEIHAADHHTRADGDYTIPALFIDGYLTGAIGKIRGHSFTGTSFRTYANDAIVLHRADDIQFANCVWEFPVLAGVTNADAAGGFAGNANTGDVFVLGGAGTATPKLPTFAGQTSGRWVRIDAEGVFAGQGAKAARIFASGDDSILQLTSNTASTVSGWTMRRDDDVSDTLEHRYDNKALGGFTTTGRYLAIGATRTIVSGAITITTGYHAVDTEGAASTDDLDTISGGIREGQELVLRAANSSRDVVLRDGVGNLRLVDNITLGHSQDRVGLMFDGTNWVELWRANNSSPGSNTVFTNFSAGGGNPTLKVAPESAVPITSLATASNANFDTDPGVDGYYQFTVEALVRKVAAGTYHRISAIIDARRVSGTMTIVGSQVDLPGGDATGFTLTLSATSGSIRANLANASGETADGFMQTGWKRSDLPS